MSARDRYDSGLPAAKLDRARTQLQEETQRRCANRVLQRARRAVEDGTAGDLELAFVQAFNRVQMGMPACE